MTIDPYPRYSNKAERADIYNDYKLKKKVIISGLYNKISAL